MGQQNCPCAGSTSSAFQVKTDLIEVILKIPGKNITTKTLQQK
jgi:hypothetical protein